MTLREEPRPLPVYDRKEGVMAIKALNEIAGKFVNYVEAAKTWDGISERLRTTVTIQHRRLCGGF